MDRGYSVKTATFAFGYTTGDHGLPGGEPLAKTARGVLFFKMLWKSEMGKDFMPGVQKGLQFQCALE